MSIEGAEFGPLSSMNEPVNPHSPVSTVAIRLKLIREIFGFSQRELAKRAGVTNSSISMIELGQVSPSTQSLERILSVIPIGLSEFFGFDLTSLIRIERACEDVSISFPVNNPSREQLSSRSIEVPVGASNGLGLLEGDLCGVIVMGEAELKSIAMTELLTVGDTFYIPGRQLHQFTNMGKTPLKLFICSLFVHSR
jgi:transcriptional regulator with XRE-family HTH domain